MIPFNCLACHRCVNFQHHLHAILEHASAIYYAIHRKFCNFHCILSQSELDHVPTCSLKTKKLPSKALERKEWNWAELSYCFYTLNHYSNLIIVWFVLLLFEVIVICNCTHSLHLPASLIFFDAHHFIPSIFAAILKFINQRKCLVITRSKSTV